MNFLKGFFTHILLIIAFVVVAFMITSAVLKDYTRHGQSLTVPEIQGLRIDHAARLLSEKKLRFVITDSLYFADKPKLAVLDQDPAPGSKVKEGRVIYITINADAAPFVNMPNLVDVSLRQAVVILQSLGLQAGKNIYKPDIAQNVVLEQLYKGRTILPEQKIAKGSTIDLVLGDGLSGAETELPDLTGLTVEEAGNLLQSSSLNVGAVVYQGPVRDSASATVVRQNPPYSPGMTLKSGRAVDLYLKQ
jgi:beta-lactam-binding protein with PASTA domain